MSPLLFGSPSSTPGPGPSFVTFDLIVDGQVVQQNALEFSSFGASTTFAYRAQGDVRAEDVRIAFTNDSFFVDTNGV